MSKNIKLSGQPVLCQLFSFIPEHTITYKDPLTGHVLKFLTNMFDYQATTATLLYKNRWNMETFFKRIKQNFELNYFTRTAQKVLKHKFGLYSSLIYCSPSSISKSRSASNSQRW